MWNIANIWKLGDSKSLGSFLFHAPKNKTTMGCTARRGDEGGDVQRHGLQLCQCGLGSGFRDGPGDARSAWSMARCGDGGHQRIVYVG